VCVAPTCIPLAIDPQARDIRLHLLVESSTISACSHIGEKRLLPLSCPFICIPAAPTEWICLIFGTSVKILQGIPHFVKKKSKSVRHFT